MTRYCASEVAELLKEELKRRPLHNLTANAHRPDALTRRIYDILNGITDVVSLEVMDEIAWTMGHPEWLQVLAPI